MAAVPTLTPRQLGRATLARQFLLARAPIDVDTAVERSIGVQAQWPRPPFVALWSRVHGFTREQLAAPLRARTLVRATMMRGTLHVLAARDYLALRATLQPMLERGMRAILRGRLDGLDLPALVERARAYFGAHTRTFEQVRDHLAGADADADARAMGYAVRNLLLLVQVPTDAAWAFPQAPEFADAEAWLGAAPASDDRTDELVLRYLAGYGPASVADMQSWLGITGLAAVVERLAGKLARFSDERGKVLFDLPDAPRPDADVEAPVRLLPEFDGAIMARADGRILAEADRKRVFLSGLRVLPTVLVDGRAVATWKIVRTKARASLEIATFAKLTKRDAIAVGEEAEALLRFAEPDASAHEVRTGTPQS
jgi:Winged helix DNA-binding domain